MAHYTAYSSIPITRWNGSALRPRGESARTLVHAVYIFYRISTDWLTVTQLRSMTSSVASAFSFQVRQRFESYLRV